jgi:hypothetical protein
VRFAEVLRGLLLGDGWEADEPWTMLQRDLAPPVEDCGVRIEVTGPAQAGVRAGVQRAAFDGSTFTRSAGTRSRRDPRTPRRSVWSPTTPRTRR